MRENEGGRYWSDHEKEVASRMRGEGFTPSEIAERLDRSAQSVRGHFQQIGMDEEARVKLRARKRCYSKTVGRTGGARAGTVHPMRADPQALADRDYRLSMAPRDLTAAFCGDPPIGYSALDRR